MREKTIIILLCIWIISVVTFVSHNNPNYQDVWNLGYYLSYYLIVLIAFVLGWTRFKHTLTRSLLIAVGFYFAFHLVIQTIEVFNPELKKQLYKGKTINYILALSCGCSLLILPLIPKAKSCLKNLLRWAKGILSPYGQ